MTETTSSFSLSLSLSLFLNLANGHGDGRVESFMCIPSQDLHRLGRGCSTAARPAKRRRQQQLQQQEEEEEQEREWVLKMIRSPIEAARVEITSKMIEEIFGIEDEVARPRKQRYRSLVSIYQQAMDMPLRSNVRYGKEVSTEGNLNRVLAREEEGDQCSKTQAIRRLF
ncbi:hypothetical protein OIU84_029081 [Salix udensis]|uniref:Uncharacterized protein n=1 Tax=Salix udensis TaxID=889485 RepID=A0AAD6P981_9ROSI|nr:hypothetical protein OIU84_029081 [Salix udensis]